MKLGPELITDEQDRNFSQAADTGNWAIFSDGTPLSTVAYDAGSMKLTFDNDGGATYLYSRLATANVPLAINSVFRLYGDFYVPAGNTNKDVLLSASSLTGATASPAVTLPDAVWTPVVSYLFVAADATGSISLGFSGTPTNADELFVDNLSIRKVSNDVDSNPSFIIESGADVTITTGSIKVSSISLSEDNSAAAKAVFIDNSGNVAVVIQAAQGATEVWSPAEPFWFNNGLIYDDSASTIDNGDVLLVYA